MSLLSFRDWRRHYGVSFSRERIGFCRWRATFTYGGNVLQVESRLPFGPSATEAMRPLIERARIAETFDGEPSAYAARAGTGKTWREHTRTFADSLRARDQLRAVFGPQMARRLILTVDTRP